MPWRVFTSRGRWGEDTRLRVECYDLATVRHQIVLLIVLWKFREGFINRRIGL